MAAVRRGRRGRRRIKARAFLGLAGGVLLGGLTWLYGPLGAIRGQSQRMAGLRATKANLLAQQAGLESDRSFLATDGGLEAAARRMGYVRPGERRLVFARELAGKRAKAQSATEGEAVPGR